MPSSVGTCALTAVAIMLPTAGIAGTAATPKPRLVGFTVTLTGPAVPGGGDRDGTGTAAIRLHTDTRKLCWTFTSKRIGTRTAAHVHRGADASLGPIVVSLGSRFKRSGCSGRLSRSLVNAMLSAPASFSVDIHTSAYPNGAIGAFWPGELEDMS